MIALFKGKYQRADYEFLNAILDEVLMNKAMCNNNCTSCDFIRPCKDLTRLHRYVHEALENPEILKK